MFMKKGKKFPKLHMTVNIFGEGIENLEIAYDSAYFLEERKKMQKFHMIVHVFGEEE